MMSDYTSVPHRWLDDSAGYGVMADGEGVGLFPLDDAGRVSPDVDPVPLTCAEYAALTEPGKFLPGLADLMSRKPVWAEDEA